MEVGTAGVEGFFVAKKKGNTNVVDPGGEYYYEYTAGLSLKESAEKKRRKKRWVDKAFFNSC